MINILQGNCGNEPTAITNIPTTTLPVSEPVTEPVTEPEPEPVTTPTIVDTPRTPGVTIPYSVETTPDPEESEPTTTGIKNQTFLVSCLCNGYQILSFVTQNFNTLNFLKCKMLKLCCISILLAMKMFYIFYVYIYSSVQSLCPGSSSVIP